MRTTVSQSVRVIWRNRSSGSLEDTLPRFDRTVDGVIWMILSHHFLSPHHSLRFPELFMRFTSQFLIIYGIGVETGGRRLLVWVLRAIIGWAHASRRSATLQLVVPLVGNDLCHLIGLSWLTDTAHQLLLVPLCSVLVVLLLLLLTLLTLGVEQFPLGADHWFSY